jgi:hypothetical protein
MTTKYFLQAAYLLACAWMAAACSGGAIAPRSLEQDFTNPPEAAKPWVFWYWMNAAVSRQGITADLEAMRSAGIGGAYLMPIQGAKNPPIVEPPVEQLSPAWWDMLRHAFAEADRLGLRLAMHDCDGFALAGGPWITPELSMQKLVWTSTQIEAGQAFGDTLAQPETRCGYYEDIAVYAYPTPADEDVSTRTTKPKISSSLRDDADLSFLVCDSAKGSFRSNDSCWLLYEFAEPFTCRSVVVNAGDNSYQAQRLIVQVSDDGATFRTLQRLQPARHGWQDSDFGVTHSLPATTARYFRFVFNREGSEAGNEDLNSAKWKPNLKISRLELQGKAVLNQHEGKAANVWRVSLRTTAEQVPDSLCVAKSEMLNITKNFKRGRLTWQAPTNERWTVLRMGHTSTGHTNATGGAGAGLECDKLNPKAIELQFDSWFGETIRQLGDELASRVLKGFHVDSWECGSQNWSPVLRKEFKRRRGYDPLPYLPAATGLPIESVDISEQFLYDMRLTISELVVDNFYAIMQKNAHKAGCFFSAESVAPTMMSDGMAHYRNADIPMGEFWLNSPTHDKPNDMLDAISAAHIYGKNIVQAEGFTQLRLRWNEHPAMLKSLGDRAFASGINRLVFHVFAHNPFTDRQPGMTLSGIGLFFQRDQTWWQPGREWMTYVQRCQALLQHGSPVVDIAVFVGDELPSRALLPERLAPTLPGIVGREMLDREAQRVANIGLPLREQPAGVFSSANSPDPADYVDMLRGYKYDSFNRDALQLAQVQGGRIALPAGSSYAMLVLPMQHPLAPNPTLMSAETAVKLLSLVNSGATLLVGIRPQLPPSLDDIATQIWDGSFAEESDDMLGKIQIKNLGRGRIVKLPYTAESFYQLGVDNDVKLTENGRYAQQIAWTHRASDSVDIYFFSNQRSEKRVLDVAMRISGRQPELWDAVSGDIIAQPAWALQNEHTAMRIALPENGSVFVVFRKKTSEQGGEGEHIFSPAFSPKPLLALDGRWRVRFDPAQAGADSVVMLDKPVSWTSLGIAALKRYSGTAQYTQTFTWTTADAKPARLWLDLGQVANLAEVTLNGQHCGIAWTPPYRVNISSALREGQNELRVDVTNTWANRMLHEYALPDSLRSVWTIVPARQMSELGRQDAGLMGEVMVVGR